MKPPDLEGGVFQEGVKRRERNPHVLIKLGFHLCLFSKQP
jgi:hypothetical protein